MKEIWKDIKGYEGLYQISNLGNVKSLIQWVGNKYSDKYIKKEKILKTSIQYANKNKNYCRCIVNLAKNKHKKSYKVHQLVAQAFIPNPKKLKEINHIDGDSLNNKIDNLEWCTHSENAIHAIKIGLRKIKYVNEELIIKEYTCNKKNIHQISNEFKINRNRIKNILIKNNVKIRTISECQEKYNINIEDFKKDVDKGLSNKELQLKYNCSIGIIATYKSRYKHNKEIKK